ncbi:MAG: alpha/beta hydrolase [Saccharospirillaceae bacterium]|nr:alpha/beta hydrolase [Pseudomonadales bacterium]NRB79341.1 alpha/beta hydrolase [Saccharospirillaceae bacterium]
MHSNFNEETYKIQTTNGMQVLLTRVNTLIHNAKAPCVFMLHDIGQSSGLYKQPDGLARFLALEGYDVFMLDLMGREGTWPRVSKHMKYSINQTITVDLSKVMAKIERLNALPSIYVGHGFGSVLLSSFIARQPEFNKQVSHFVHINARRLMTLPSAEYKFIKDFFWFNLAKLQMMLFGQVDTKKIKLGSCIESKVFYEQYLALSHGPWIDPEDEFDYASAILKKQFPKSLYLSDQFNDYLAHQEDVRAYIKELGPHNAQVMWLSKKSGSLKNYKGVKILTDPSANEDHFVKMINWLQGEHA